MTVIAEQGLDRQGSDEKVMVRLYAPYASEARKSWVCRFEIGEPVAHAMDVCGETGLQALTLALSSLSAALYGCDLYRRGELGAFGAFGGYLGVPAPQVFLDEAPYPF